MANRFAHPVNEKKRLEVLSLLASKQNDNRYIRTRKFNDSHAANLCEISSQSVDYQRFEHHTLAANNRTVVRKIRTKTAAQSIERLL